MADIAVSFAIEQLLPLLIKEGKKLKGIHKEFADIKDELESIQSFLKDADRKAAAEKDNQDEGIKTWVKQVREAAFRIEDIVDEYMVYVGQRHLDTGSAVSLTKVPHFIKTLIPRHDIASKIQEIKSHVREIKSRAERYDFQREPLSSKQESSKTRVGQNVEWNDPRMAALYLQEAELVGFEAPRNELIGWLTKGKAERTVISVVAMGGQGKTTLAKKVFDNKNVVDHFDFHVWITVSQSYTVEGLLRNILEKLCEERMEEPPQNILQMDRDSLTNKVRSYLQQKRYVIVFDDVWKEQFWREIEFAMLDDENGSRIMITTRIMDVALFCKISSFVHVHELKPLTEGESLGLFHKKAFQFDSNGCCPEDLKHISLEIVKKCKGLPLAIVTIGGLLSYKEKNVFEWELFSRNLSSELENDSHLNDILKILGFSYDDLSYHLKSCLLYFGVYPENYVVNTKRLIRQWIVEGFVKHEKGKSLEETARQYLTNLINRNLVQVSSFTIDDKVKSCHVHDMIREMILKKCEELSFCHHVNTITKNEEPAVGGIIRRLSTTTNSIPSHLTRSTEGSHVRSMFVLAYSENAERIPTEHKFLKVLDFQNNHRLYSVPRDLGNLIHLKYLNLRNTSITSLPRSIGKLQSLETLDIKGIYMGKLPKEISKLRKLQHLSSLRMFLTKLKDGIGDMISLQTLELIDGDEEVIVRELGKLRQLRKLGLFGVKEQHGRILCSSINELHHLEKLYYYSLDEVIDLQAISSPPMMLRKLQLQER